MSALHPWKMLCMSVLGGIILLALAPFTLPAYADSDFNDDGRDDLAIGVPGESVGNKQLVGAVNALYGSSSGISSSGDQLWHQDVSGVESTAATPEAFGSSLANGDFDGDGHADLAIGVPSEAVSSIQGAGAVNVLYGSSSKLSSAGDQLWTQDSPGVLDAAEQSSQEDVFDSSDKFGHALATGDFNGDGRDDLAIGVPGENVRPDVDAGAVNVLYGSSSGLTATGD